MKSKIYRHLLFLEWSEINGQILHFWCMVKGDVSVDRKADLLQVFNSRFDYTVVPWDWHLHLYDVLGHVSIWAMVIFSILFYFTLIKQYKANKFIRNAFKEISLLLARVKKNLRHTHTHKNIRIKLNFRECIANFLMRCVLIVGFEEKSHLLALH